MRIRWGFSRIFVLSIIGAVAPFIIYISPLSPLTTDNSSLHSLGLLGQSHAETSELEVKYAYNERILDGDAEIISGYVQILEDVIDSERSCEFCTYIAYTPGPIGNSTVTYADSKPHNLVGAKKMTFFIMGANGGEKVSFDVAGSASSNNATDVSYAAETNVITLTKKWQKIEIDLRPSDLSEITHPLSIHILESTPGVKVAFYIKFISFDTDNPIRPIPVTRNG